MDLPFQPLPSHTHVFGGVLFPAVYLLFQLESVHFKLFAHRLVLLFYALSYLCSIFDSSAGKKNYLKKTSNSNSKQTKPTTWGKESARWEHFLPQGSLGGETVPGHRECWQPPRLLLCSLSRGLAVLVSPSVLWLPPCPPVSFTQRAWPVTLS